jgi:hypothetical protein
MTTKLFKVAVFAVVLNLHGSVFSQASPTLTGRDRIVRADRPDSREFDEGKAPAIEIVYVAVGSKQVEINQAFFSDENWLRNLKIGIRNVSPYTLTCAGIAFGLLAEVDTKLKTNESWPWGLGFYRGDCFPGRSTNKSFLGKFTTKKLRLGPGEETVLDSSDVPPLYNDKLTKMGGLAKAVFREYTWIRFKGRKSHELPIAFSRRIQFLEDSSF